MEKYEFKNPNDIIRNRIKKLFKYGKSAAALTSNSPYDMMRDLFYAIETLNSSEYDLLLSVMFVDYTLYLHGLGNTETVIDEEEDEDIELVDGALENKPGDEIDESDLLSEDEMIKSITTLEELKCYIKENPSLLYDMAMSVDVREIELAHLYRLMHSIDDETKSRLILFYKPFVYDYMELSTPFILSKMHTNFKNNSFLEDVTSKSISAIDLMEEVKSSSKEDYRSMVLYYLEIYYKHKKYGVNFLDSILTKKERELINLLDKEKLDEALDMLDKDSDLLEMVLNVYSEYYFEEKEIGKNVERYFSTRDNQKKLTLIFRKDK